MDIIKVLLQWSVLQAFIAREQGEYRHRNMPTLSTQKMEADMPGRKHPALGKIVYVIPEQRFAKIVEVDAEGMQFNVEMKKERARDTEQERRMHELATRHEDGSVKAIGRQETVQWQGTDLLAT